MSRLSRWTAAGPALLLLAALPSCDLDALFTAERPPVSSGLPCDGDGDCPEDMLCRARVCSFGSRTDGGDRDVDNRDVDNRDVDNRDVDNRDVDNRDVGNRDADNRDSSNNAGDATRTDRALDSSGGGCVSPTCEELGRQCGTWADPCGGSISCPGCGANMRCSATGVCECRYQSCGGSCCAADELCDDGLCCAPLCGARVCGDDGCGGTCGACGSGEVCSPSGVCIAADCDEDRYEPNDTAAQAISLGLPSATTGLRLCDPSEDWWRYTATEAGEDLQVQISFAHADADLDLQVLGATGALLASGQSTDDDELAQVYDLAPADYLIRVFSFDHQDVAYQLSVERPPPCDDDAYEPNDQQPEAASVGAAPIGRVDLDLCPNDDDWLLFSVQEGDSVQINLHLAPEQQNTYFATYDNASGDYLGSGQQDAVGQIGRLYNLPAGEIAVSVGSGLPQHVPYGFSVELIAPCPNDGLEPNDTRETATAFAASRPATLAGLTVCPPEEDWFTLHSDGQPFSFTIDSDGPIDAQLFNAVEAFVTSASAGWRVEVHHQPAGNYTVKVRSYEPVYSSYGITIDGAAGCAQDAFEPNEGSGEATAVSLPFTASGLTICNPDQDVFAFTAGQGQRLTAELDYVRDSGELFLLVIRADYTWSEASFSDGDQILLEADLEVAGDYLLQVQSNWNSSNSYDLSISLE